MVDQATPVVKAHIEFRDGHARIAGRTLKAEYVARMHVAGKESIEAVMAHYQLTRAEVHAALAYYYDNRALLDAAYEQALEQGLQQGAVWADEYRAEIEARMKVDQ